ncbi:unnamed protein product [Caenorhabditis sp. 36 PRJEB53466]|nr:unnamed protein product [Caenorhabditis sp. 36 PRJEB53466]
MLLFVLPLLLLTTAHADAEVIVSVTPKAVAHLFKKEISSLHKSLLRLEPSAFRAKYLGLDVTIDKFQVVDLKMPRITYETSPASSFITFKLLGGSARVIGQYSAVYKTKREGQFEMSLEHFHLAIPVQRTGLLKFTPSSDSCTLEVDETMISLTPALPEQISVKIKNDLLEQLRRDSCARANAFFSKLNSQLNNFVESTDITQGGHPSHIAVDLQLQSASIEDDSAVHVEITESVINAELSKLFSSANTRFLWNDVPEIKALLKNCDSAECRLLEDGDLASSFFDRPSVKINSDDSASVRLPLSTVLTTSNGKELFRIQSELHLDLEDILVEQPEQGAIAWSAKFRVKKVDIQKTTSSRSIQKFMAKLESWIGENKSFIENLLSFYLRGNLPIQLRSPITWSHRLHARPDSSSSSVRLQLHPHFSPSLLV